MVNGKVWFRIKDPPAGEGQVGQSQYIDSPEGSFNRLLSFTFLLFYLFYAFESNHSHLFWRGAGGEALSLLGSGGEALSLFTLFPLL